MYEDVCLQCGKPIVDGRAYCSDDCESQDQTSPSISTASSTFPSPHLTFSINLSAAERDIPALLPSALGESHLRVYSPHVYPWSSFSDADDDHEHDVKSTLHEDFDPSDKSPFLTPVIPTGLSYARRPSSTNNHSTIPLVLRRSSSGVSSPTRPLGVPQSAPSPMALVPYFSSTEEGFSDNQDSKSSILQARQAGATLNKSKKRNRASLPTYFSLLQLTSTSKDSKHKSTRSVSKTCAQTPRIRDHSFAITAPSTSAVASTTVMASHGNWTVRGRDRVRSRSGTSSYSLGTRSSSPSCRNSFKVRVTSPSLSPCKHHLTQRRIESMEKVTDWFTSSSISRQRRKSSPLPGGDDESWESDDTSPESQKITASDERRGRRRISELGKAPSEARGAAGFGNGRSGIRDRERRGMGL